MEPFTYHTSLSISINSLVSVIFNNRVKEAVIIEETQKPSFDTLEIIEISDSFFSQKQLQLAKFIASYYICSLGDALSLMTPFLPLPEPRIHSGPVGMSNSLAQVKTWVPTQPLSQTNHSKLSEPRIHSGHVGTSKHLAQFRTWVPCQLWPRLKPGFRGFLEPRIHSGLVGTSKHLAQVKTWVPEESKIVLSSKQEEALHFLKEHKVSLLFGDTGSGKTEIYMKYFEAVLREGKKAIFLMPEISLTPQMSTRLKEHFGEHFVIWHSKLTPLQKRKALQKIRSGEAKIIAGARSALFLPIEDLGLIVVDEEHDDSYKSSSRPRYHARDIAIYMGKLYDIPVVLGSATPSLSSYVKFPHARLQGGHFSSKKEFVYEPSPEALTPLIEESLKSTLEKKEQSIVFLPTRANFKYLICGDCGHTFKCAFCSVGMSLHQNSRAMKCHYCNFTQAIPQVCPECGSAKLVSSRLGTAEAVKSIREFLPHARIEQFDRDVITTASKLKKALKRFNDRESDILVGTQMLSKGHDYHDVTLAVVLGMDNMLNMGDYRAREKALSSLIQVAGRSGRAKDAKVIVQSFNEPFFRSYYGKYEEFLEDEKLFREELYPPFKKLCRILFSHKNGAKAQEAMREMEEKLRAFKSVEVVGAKKCAIERVANKYRFEILLRADKSTDIIKAVRGSMVTLAEVDMDPIEFG